jgi:hypothetical protein
MQNRLPSVSASTIRLPWLPTRRFTATYNGDLNAFNATLDAIIAKCQCALKQMARPPSTVIT